VVMHTKQHLAALIPSGNALVLNTLRWGGELRDVKDLDLPADGVKATGIREKELAMAEQLIGDMTERLNLGKFRDTFRDDILALVKRKVKAGKTELVETPEAPEESAPSNVIDLTELLKRSLHGGKTNGSRAPAAKARKRAAPAKAKAAPAEKRRHAS
jgi:DNA end-binding protein Ku